MKAFFICNIIFILSCFADIQGKNVCMLIGEREYSSSQSMPSVAVQLEEEFDLNLTYLTVPKNGKIENLEKINSADLLIFFINERNIPKNQFKQIESVLKKGTSAMAFKTTSLAFPIQPQWFLKWFGGAFQGASDKRGMKICALPENDHHPIVRDLEVKSFKSSDNLIFPGPLSKDSRILLMGKASNSHAVPVAWTRERPNGQRLFYTSLGKAEEFETDYFMNLIKNAVLWCLDKSIKTPPPKKEENIPHTPPLVLPVNAKVIFNGENFDNWRHWDIRQTPRSIGSSENYFPYFNQIKDHTPRWNIENEALVPIIGQEDIITKNSYKNFHFHANFYIPEEPAYVPRDFRGAGGIFISGRYEIQLLASSELKKLHTGGALFNTRAPDRVAPIKVGEWNSIDIHYEHKDTEPMNIKVNINNTNVHSQVKIIKPTPYGIINPLSTKNANEVSLFSSTIDNALKYNMGLKKFTVATRFKTKSETGTLLARTSPISGWEPDGKAFFILGGELQYDIGWKSIIRSYRKVNDGNWNYALLTNDGDMCTMYVNGQVAFMKRDFKSPDRDTHVFKIGYDFKNFYKQFDGEISDVFYFDRVLTDKEAVELMKTNKSPGGELLHWQPSDKNVLTPENLKEKDFIGGPIRIQGDFSKVRYANMWIKER